MASSSSSSSEPTSSGASQTSTAFAADGEAGVSSAGGDDPAVDLVDRIRRMERSSAIDIVRAALAAAATKSAPPASVVANADAAAVPAAAGAATTTTTDDRRGVSFSDQENADAATAAAADTAAADTAAARIDGPHTIQRHHQSLNGIELPPFYTDDDDVAPEQDPAQLEGVNNITGEGESVLHFYILRKPHRALDLAARGSPRLINLTYTGKHYYGETALHLAAMGCAHGGSGHGRRGGETLLAADYDVTNLLLLGVLLFRDAGEDKLVNKLAEGIEFRYDVKFRGSLYMGQTVLQFAACSGNLPAVKVIVESVGWVKMEAPFKETPSYWTQLKEEIDLQAKKVHGEEPTKEIVKKREADFKKEKKKLILAEDKYGHNVFHILAMQQGANPAIIRYLKEELSRVDDEFTQKLERENDSSSIFRKPDSHCKTVNIEITKRSNSGLTPVQLGVFKGNPHALDMLRLSNWKFGRTISSLVQVDQLTDWGLEPEKYDRKSSSNSDGNRGSHSDANGSTHADVNSSPHTDVSSSSQTNENNGSHADGNSSSHTEGENSGSHADGTSSSQTGVFLPAGPSTESPIQTSAELTCANVPPSFPNATADSATRLMDGNYSGLLTQTQLTTGSSRVSTTNKPEPLHTCSSPWSRLSALEIAVAKRRSDVISHPLMQAILQIKWHLYGRRKFLKSLIYTTVTIVLFTIALALQPANPYQRFKYTDANYVARIVMELFAAVVLLSNTFFIIRKLLRAGSFIRGSKDDLNQGLNSDPKVKDDSQGKSANFLAAVRAWYRHWRRTNQTFEFYFFPIFRLLFLSAFGYRMFLISRAIAISTSDHIAENQDWLEGNVRADNVLLGSAAIFGWLGLLYFSKAFPELGPLYIAIRRAVFRDLRSWTVLFAMVLFGFASAFFLQKNGYHDFASGDGVDGGALNLGNQTESAGGSVNATDFLPSYWDSWPASVLATFRTLFQQTDYERFSNASVVPFAKFLDVIFTLFTLVLVLNILIAKLSQSFTTIASDSQKIWRVQFANLIAEIDLLLDKNERELFSNNIGHRDHTEVNKKFITVIERNELSDSVATNQELLKVIVAFEYGDERHLWTKPASNKGRCQAAPAAVVDAASRISRSGASATGVATPATSLSAQTAAASPPGSTGHGSEEIALPIEIDLSRGLWYEWHYSLFTPSQASILYERGRQQTGSHHETAESMKAWLKRGVSSVFMALIGGHEKMQRPANQDLESGERKTDKGAVNLWKTHYLRVEATSRNRDSSGRNVTNGVKFNSTSDDCFVLD